MSEKQSRSFLGVLYPDSTSYVFVDVLVRLKDTFPELAYITHDRDVDENGELKKPHLHWCGKRSSPALLSTISNSLGIEANAIEFCKSWKYSLRYLIHADNPEKFQYEPGEVTANFPFNAVIEGKLEAMKSRKIFNFINENPTISLNSLAEWAFKEDVWSEYRRSFSIWASLLRELQYQNMEVSKHEN